MPVNSFRQGHVVATGAQHQEPEPAGDQAAFVAAARQALGDAGFVRDPDLLAPWLTDWRGRYTGAALGMALPTTTQQVAALVRLCAQHRVPIVPQGGNTGMSGGATPDASGRAIILSLRRMAAIDPIDTAGRRVTCGAGAILSNLHDAAAAAGLRFALSLGAKGSATIGGLIATNAGGTQVLRHGSMRAAVLGLEAVLADGAIWSSLTPLKKDNRGFDLKQLFIGSEGTLGIITAATLRLVPAIAERAVIWCGVPSLHAARGLLLHCERVLGDAVEGFEVLPQSCLDAVLGHVPGARAPLAGPHAWHALIEVVADAGSADTLAARVEGALAAALADGLVADAALAASETQAQAFWTLRESISAAERAKGPAKQHDIAVPPEAMPDFVAAAVDAVHDAFPGTHAFGYGHLGDGNVHFHVLAPPGADRAAWEAGDGQAITRLVHDLVTGWHGTISAEHGIGQMKREDLARLMDPAGLHLLRGVKQALDPAGIMNPGKLL